MMEAMGNYREPNHGYLNDYLLYAHQSLRTLLGTLVVKSIVSSELPTAVAKSHMPPMNDNRIQTIAEQIQHDLQSGEHIFMFGFEESYDTLEIIVRDKDAVRYVITYRSSNTSRTWRNKTLYDGLQALYANTGTLRKTISATAAGLWRAIKDQSLIRQFTRFRSNKLWRIESKEAQDFAGTSKRCWMGSFQKIGLQISNVLKYFRRRSDHSFAKWYWTKIKFYVGARADNELLQR